MEKEKFDMVGCTCHPSYGGKPKIGGSWFRPAWANNENLSPR
jgi:hypothetical protein